MVRVRSDMLSREYIPEKFLLVDCCAHFLGLLLC